MFFNVLLALNQPDEDVTGKCSGVVGVGAVGGPAAISASASAAVGAPCRKLGACWCTKKYEKFHSRLST